ncbi:MAG: MlaE family lipid ABC transporter permease subunit [Gammaproteobacteria bacterium]|nr:MlaE family lipid ABC transporter permease subunit [Gammaproteobacteria bacterium]
MSATAWVELHAPVGGDAPVLRAGGDWRIVNAGQLDSELTRLDVPGDRVVVDMAALESLDTAGAWLLYRTLKLFEAQHKKIALRGARNEHHAMLREVAANDSPCEIAPPQVNTVVRVVLAVGRATVDALRAGRDFVIFFGAAVVTFLRVLLQPRRLRWNSLVYQMEQVGFNALPIVGLIAFLIGVVLAYQGAVQLQRLGAEVFVVDLIAVSVLREVGILLTAIVVAGRSGSAFTAQIGSMKANEEVDALRTLGMDPMDILVLPRVLALVITLPMLAFFADMMGLLGGGLMAWVVLDISPAMFVERLRHAVTVWSFLVGIIKAPFFAVVIALVGCHEGLQVTGSAESVGSRTTRAVVEAIFLVIVLDAAFSIFFSVVGV